MKISFSAGIKLFHTSDAKQFFYPGGVAARMEGDECENDISNADSDGDCFVTLFIEDSENILRKYEVKCNELPGEIPGSNMYYSCWSCMLSSIAIAFKWKASQALKFAQAQAERQQRSERDAREDYIGEDESVKAITNPVIER